MLGAVISRILLSIVLLLRSSHPIAVFRGGWRQRFLEVARAFKASKDSVMLERNHTFIGRELNGSISNRRRGNGFLEGSVGVS